MIGTKLHIRLEYRRLRLSSLSGLAGPQAIPWQNKQQKAAAAFSFLHEWPTAQDLLCTHLRGAIGWRYARKLPTLRKSVIGMGQQTLAELSDAALIEVCLQRGTKDDRPFQELFRRYQSVVWRVCYSTMRNREDAEDLTQEVFFKVHRSLGQFEGRSSFKTWLYRVAINSCQNEIRRRGRRPQEAETEMETIAEVMPSGQSVEKIYQAKFNRELLAKALTNLDASVSEILYMKDMEDRPYNEIADLLEIGVSAAKMRVQRARLALQVQYRLLAGDEQ